MRNAISFLVLGAMACAHPPARAPETPRPSWPPPPAPALVRYVTAIPDPAARPPAPPRWRRVLDVIVGTGERRRSAEPLLARPFGVGALKDELLVADPDARRVLRMDWRRGTFASVECPDRAWVMPMAAAGAPDGAIWVADGGAGELVRVADRTCSAIGKGALERPTGLAIDASRVWAVDPPRHAVVAFSADGRELLRIGARGEGPGRFNFPTAAALDAEGNLLVVDSLNFRVSRLAPDGRFLGSFGEPGDGAGAFGRPKGIAVDRRGRIFVSDAQADAVAVFQRDGDFLVSIGGGGAGAGDLTLPAGVAVSGDHLFVADSQRHRVQVYELVELSP